MAIVSNDLYYKDLLYGQGMAELAVEFKFQPSKMRGDEVCIHKFPVVFWPGIVEDVNRVKRFVKDKRTKKSIAIFVDEFGYYKRPQYAIQGGSWTDWGNCGSQNLNISVFYTKVF